MKKQIDSARSLREVIIDSPRSSEKRAKKEKVCEEQAEQASHQ